MAKFQIALNIEFCRSADKFFEDYVRIGSDLNYKFVESMIYSGWELLSEVNTFHSFSMEENPLLMKEIFGRYGGRGASLSAYSPLMKPEAPADHITRTAVLASIVECDFLNSDEMVKPDWMDDELVHQAMRYTLEKITRVCARHKKYLCIEPHGIYTKTAARLLKTVRLFESPWFAVNWDTGNRRHAGVEYPYKGLEFVRDHVRPIFLPVECGKIDEAERLLACL